MDNANVRGIERTASALRAARVVAAITGAGISAESGVPTFRGAGGLWRTHRPEDLATPEAFARDPGLVWEWYRWRRDRIRAARPNAGHLTLARFEQRIPEFTLLTQNVDGLHAEAGSRRLIELHGNIWRARCSAEPARLFHQREEAPATAAVPLCPSCGAFLRPDVVWFGEALDPVAVDEAVDAARRCDVLLVVGTSSVVYPVAALPSVAKRGRATVVEVNVEATPLTPEADIVLRGAAGALLPEVERLL